MLESLMEIEIAFSLLKAGDAVHDKDPIDAHYEKLNTDIEVRVVDCVFMKLLRGAIVHFILYSRFLMKPLRNSLSLESMCPTLTQLLIHSTRLI